LGPYDGFGFHRNTKDLAESCMPAGLGHDWGKAEKEQSPYSTRTETILP
jgi:hypothetical protein